MTGDRCPSYSTSLELAALEDQRSPSKESMPRLICSLALLLELTGCPSSPRDRSLPPCSKFGDRCEFLPGKLGSCVQRDGCTGTGCFVCQSQH